MESKILSFALIVMATGIGWWFYQVARLCLKATKTQAWVAPIVFWSLNLLSPTIEAIVKDTELASKVFLLSAFLQLAMGAVGLVLWNRHFQKIFSDSG